MGAPATAQAEAITDLETLVEYLSDHRDQSINLRALTSLSQISSNPVKPYEPKSVGETFTGALNGGGIEIVVAGSPLFSRLSDARIENLQLSGEINASSSPNVGALASVADSSEIINVTAQNVVIEGGVDSGIIVGASQDSIYKDVKVVNSEISGSTGVGGVLGNSLRDSFESILVKDVQVEGRFEGSDPAGNVGGVAGISSSSLISLTQVESTTVRGSKANTGGLVGYLDSSTVSNVIVRGIEVNGFRSVGGLAGYANRNTSQSFISNVIVQGTIQGGDDVGGISGYSNLPLTNTIVLGAVNGDDNVGGLVGIQAGNDAHVRGSSFTGSVSGQDSVGGLVGEASVLIENSISIADVQGNSEVGGLVGTWHSPETSTAATHLYSEGTVSGSTFVGGLVGQVKPYEEFVKCENWIPWYGGRTCTSPRLNANYLEFDDVRSSSYVNGDSQTGSLFGAAANPTNEPAFILNGSARFEIRYPRNLNDSIQAIGFNSEKYTLVSYSDTLDTTTMAENTRKLAQATKNSQSSVFVNSDLSSGGVEVFTSWAGLVASETGVWGQCAPGSLPYLRAIVKVNPCPSQASPPSIGNPESGSVSLRANALSQQNRDSSSQIAESLAKMITSGEKVDLLSLRNNGFENMNLKVQSELNSLTGSKDPEEVKKELESILVKASFFDLGFQPSPKTFEFFGIRGVSEKLIPQILDLVRNSADSSISGLAMIEKVTNRVLILDLISGSDQRPRLSAEIVIKAGLVDSKSPHIKLVARMIARLSPTQVDTVEKLVKAATEVKVKAETRMSKLQQRKLAFAA